LENKQRKNVKCDTNTIRKMTYVYGLN